MIKYFLYASLYLSLFCFLLVLSIFEELEMTYVGIIMFSVFPLLCFAWPNTICLRDRD